MNRRAWLVTAVIVVLGLLNVVALALFFNARTSPDASSSDLSLRPAEQSASTGPDGEPSSAPTEDGRGSTVRDGIELTVATKTARPGETVAIEGRHAGGTAGDSLVVQRRIDGTWKDFPLPTVLFPSLRFESYIQLTAPGRYQVRVLDPVTGEASNAVPLRVQAIDV
jgi:hypothetical protein